MGDERFLRRLMAGAALASAAGAFVAGTVSRGVGAVLLLAGWAAFLWALHRHGRLGEG